ncbi:MAG: hypothetical protein ACOVVK_06440 [Elsteraceae bacterium]
MAISPQEYLVLRQKAEIRIAVEGFGAALAATHDLDNECALQPDAAASGVRRDGGAVADRRQERGYHRRLARSTDLSDQADALCRVIDRYISGVLAA